MKRHSYLIGVVLTGMLLVADTTMASDVLIVTSSRLSVTDELENTVQNYQDILTRTQGLDSEYIKLDSQQCAEIYGTRVSDLDDWQEVRRVLSTMIQTSGAKYVLLLGGTEVVPRPVISVPSTGGVESVASDAWYVDLNDDQIVDEGLSIGRMADTFSHSDAVHHGLQTAVALHQLGGYTLENLVSFSLTENPTPPYGICGACTLSDEFFSLLSASDYVEFLGHGSPQGIYNNDYELKFSINAIESVDFETHHPIIVAYYCCNTGVLARDEGTWGTELIRAGAAAFVGRTTTAGVPTRVASDFPAGIEGELRIGDALFSAMRTAVLDQGDNFKASAAHLVLYGDPTLRRRIVSDLPLGPERIPDPSDFAPWGPPGFYRERPERIPDPRDFAPWGPAGGYPSYGGWRGPWGSYRSYGGWGVPWRSYPNYGGWSDR